MKPAPLALLKRPLFWGLLVAVVAAIFLWRQFAGPKVETQWLTEAVTRGNLEDTTTALGTLQPLNYVDVGTQVSGQLTKLHVDLGYEVKKGDLLAEIDPTVLKVRVEGDMGQLESLRAQLTERQANLALAREQFTRQEQMLKANATSRDAYDSARSNLRGAEAQIKQIQGSIRQIESSLEGNQANLGYTRIYAPLTGMVVSKEAREGQTLNANMSAPVIMRVADLDTMTVQAEVSEADVVRLKPGMEVYFSTLGEPDRKWRSTLRQILPTPTVENDVVLYNVLFDVENKDRSLKIEMSAHVFFVHAKAEDTLIIPLAAIALAKQNAPQRKKDVNSDEPRSTPPGDVVLVMRDGQVVPQRVKIGVKNRVHAQVLEGLEVGDIVVVGRTDPNAKISRPQGGGPRAPGGRL